MTSIFQKKLSVSMTDLRVAGASNMSCFDPAMRSLYLAS